MLLRSGQLPASGGTPATVLVTMTVEQLESRTRLVTTGHGGQLTVSQALRLAGEQALLFLVPEGEGKHAVQPGQQVEAKDLLLMIE
jgi:hypothetical protein